MFMLLGEKEGSVVETIEASGGEGGGVDCCPFLLAWSLWHSL